VRLADRVVLVDQGRVADEGTHAELLERSELYRRLMSELPDEPTPDEQTADEQTPDERAADGRPTGAPNLDRPVLEQGLREVTASAWQPTAHGGPERSNDPPLRHGAGKG